jgi:hypothetical protein
VISSSQVPWRCFVRSWLKNWFSLSHFKASGGPYLYILWKGLRHAHSLFHLAGAHNDSKDVHLAIEMACHGTAASRFIETRQYELDESTTDATVDKGDILRRIEKCKMFEITITFSRLEVSANTCPRCGTSHSGVNQTGWIRW